MSKQRIARKSTDVASANAVALRERPFGSPISDVESAAPALGFNALAMMAPASGVPALQPKLTVGPAHDTYEEEADRTAAQVVEHIHSTSADAAPDTQAQRKEFSDYADEKEEDDEKKKYLQTKSLIQRQGLGDGGDAAPGVEATIQQSRGLGQSLPSGIQRQMSEAFGVDFSTVKVHTDDRAHAMNEALYSRAFTTGQDIFFRAGEFQPSTPEGQTLLAHELTHVVQQTGGGAPVQTKSLFVQPKLVNNLSAAPQGTVQRGLLQILGNAVGGMIDSKVTPLLGSIPYIGPILSKLSISQGE